MVTTLWSQTGGTSVSLSSPFGLETSFVAPELTVTETLIFSLVAQDSTGMTASDIVEVEVLAPNQLPVVDAGPDQSVSNGDFVQLQGSASDPDGLVQVVEWLQIAGEPVTISSSSSLSPTFTASSTATEVLQFMLVATDDEGDKGGDLVEIEVLVEDPCCFELGPGVPGSASLCLDSAAFECLAQNEPFCAFGEWDFLCSAYYSGTFIPFFFSCPVATTCSVGFP